MKKVVIVDDEYIVTQGLSQLIHWEDFGMEIAGVAYDGDSGLSLVCDVQPDLVFTDIRMPGMSGLDLISQARKRVPNAAFVIISGFNDFEYVRSALRLNVFDYLDKPITMEKMNDVLDRYRRAGEEAGDEANEAQQSVFKQCMQACVQLCLLSGRASEQQLREVWSRRGLRVPELEILICAQVECGDQAAFRRIERELNRELQETSVTISSVTGPKGGIFLCHAHRSRMDAQLLRGQICRVCSRLAEQEIQLHIGLSGNSPRLCDLPEAVEAAQAALNYAVFLDEDHVCVEDVMPVASLPAAYGKSEQTIAFSMRVGDRKAVIDTIEALLKNLVNYGVSMDLFCHEVLELIYLGLHVLREAGVEYKFDSGLPHVEIQRHRSVYELRKWVLACFDDFMDRLNAQSQTKGRKSVQKAREFIDQHYGEPITLEQLAEICDMNPTYFSMLFKLQVGQTYVKYINRVRMEQAKSMLMQGISIRRISENVGFTSQRYFSDRFKAYWGCTPTQLREKMQEEKKS